MANPQADKYTKISNELLEALAKIRIAGEARQMLDVIIRKTYGFNKKEDRISTSQFMYLTGLSNRSIHKARKKLLDLNLITIHQKGDSQVLTYCIQKDYHRWQPYPKRGIPQKGDTPKGPELYPKKAQTIPKKGTAILQKKLYKRKKESARARVRDIDIREKDFLKELHTYPQFSSIIKEFFDYWSEPNKSKTKMRFEQQKTWDTKRRLQRWANNDFGKKKKFPDRTAQIEKEQRAEEKKRKKWEKDQSPPPESTSLKGLLNTAKNIGQKGGK